MAKEKEILEYKLDITDVEAKAQRIKTLTEEISAKRGRGEDTSGLEANLNKEIGAVGRLGREEKKTASETENLVRQKDKLGNVVQVLGGRFGGLVGQLGGVAELLIRGGRTAIGFGAALMALTGGIAVVQKLRNALREAREEQEKLNQAVTEGKLGQMGVQQGMDVELERFGLRTGEGSRAAWMMHARLMKQFGFSQERAAGIAPLAVASGLGTEQAGVLGVLQGMGIQVETPAQVHDAMAKIQAEGSDVYAEAQRRLHGIRGTQAGRTWQRTGELLLPRRPGLTAEEQEFAAREQAGMLPPGVENIGQFKAKLDEAAEAYQKLQQRRERLAALGDLRPGQPGRAARARLILDIADLEGQLGDWGPTLKQVDRERARQAGWLPPPGEGSPTTQPAGVQADAAMEGRVSITVNETNEYIGSQYNVGKKKARVTSNHGVHSPGEAARWKLPR